jgi:prolyl 4-hydroxylase
LTNHIAKEYADKLGDLMPYLQMAYTQTHMDTKKTSETIAKKQQLYHTINESYPNLQQIHSSPDIYTVTDFLSQDECDRIIRKARLNIQPCLVKNEDTGAVEVDPSRTSTNANIPRCEVPSITKKIVELGNCVEEQMETLQVLNYKRGQEFKPHTDGFDGATTACGFQDSGRIATVFCYLNDVKAGGTTLFHKVGLEIEPKQGMAVVHFPMSLDLVEDEMTEHQGSVAIDEKWILTTWIWKNWKADYRYAEENIEALSDDII